MSFILKYDMIYAIKFIFIVIRQFSTVILTLSTKNVKSKRKIFQKFTFVRDRVYKSVEKYLIKSLSNKLFPVSSLTSLLNCAIIIVRW